MKLLFMGLLFTIMLSSNAQSRCFDNSVVLDFLSPWTTSGYGVQIHTQITGQSVMDWDGALLSTGRVGQSIGWNVPPKWNETLELKLKAEVLTDPLMSNSPTIQLHTSGSSDDWIIFSGLNYGVTPAQRTVLLYVNGNNNPVARVTLKAVLYPDATITWQ